MADEKKITESVIDRIDALTQKLGVASEKVWAAMVTAQAVNAKRDAAVCWLWMMAGFVMWGWTAYVSFANLPHLNDVWHHGNELTDGGTAMVVTAAICGLVGLVVIFGSIQGLITAHAKLATTEAEAFKEIAQSIFQ